MIPMMRCFLLAALLFVAHAGDVTGIWSGMIQGRNGEPQDISFRFQQHGETLTGKMYGETEDVPIADGRIAAGEVRFSVPADFGGGRFRLVFTGTVKDGEMHLTREREGGGSGGRSNLKQTFTLKRL